MITDRAGAGTPTTRGLYVDFRVAFAIVALAFVAISVYSASIQKITLTRFGDGDEYFFAAEQRVAHETIRAEAPFVYRIALPWLVATTFPDRIELGFRFYNIAAAALSALLLLVWLDRFGITPGVAALTTILYIANWIGPARFLYYYPIYVDPPFIALSMAALLLIHALRQRFSWPRLAALSAVCFIGALFRETMLFAPVAFLFANVDLVSPAQSAPRVPAVARLIPLVVTLIAVVLCHLMPSEPRRVLPFISNVVFLFRTKALFTLVLAPFMTFGAVIAFVMYDWRAACGLIGRHFYLLVFCGGCFAAGYLGGHETERYFLWAAPVVYLLVAGALERHGAALMRSAWVFVLVVGAQALGEHVFFGIPDPSLAVGDWATLRTVGERAWGAINRLVIVDDFSWNIWSYFGSRPFHALLLGIYVAFSAFLIAYLRWAERPHPIQGAH